jgi:NAD+ diphosphatase
MKSAIGKSMSFEPAFQLPSAVSADALWFVYRQDRLLLKRSNSSGHIPDTRDLKTTNLSPTRKQYLGALDGRECYAAELPDIDPDLDGFDLVGLRETFGHLDEELIWIAGRANQLVDWNRNHRYCGQCGNPTKDRTAERAKICPSCGLVNYPRLSPAVIVAVIRNDELLLATNKRFKSGFFSVLAGFVEPGETLEECVAREIQEEVGICVKNIRYFGSQPWPFPNSLMVGFLADYDSGEIHVNRSEIVEAGWFRAHNLPSIPPRITIARHLIDWFVHQQFPTTPRTPLGR